MILGGLFVALAASEFAVLFTDAQWVDVQSFLNFCVLVIIAVRQRRQPQEIAHSTSEEVAQQIADPDGLRGEIAEIIIDAMEKRSKDYPHRQRADSNQTRRPLR